MEASQHEIKAAVARLERSQLQMKNRQKTLHAICRKPCVFVYMWLSINHQAGCVMSHQRN